MRCDELVAGGRAERRGRARGGDGLLRAGQRPRRSHAASPPAVRRRDGDGHQAGPSPRHSACSTRVGCRAGFRGETQTLFCGDLFTAFGHHPPATEEEIVGPAIAAEDMGGNATCLSPALGPTIRGLADLEPLLLAPMHAPVFTGDCVQSLHDLAQAYEERLAAETVRYREASSSACVRQISPQLWRTIHLSAKLLSTKELSFG